EQPGVLATLSRWRSWVQIPSGTLDGTVRKPAKRPSSNLGECLWVRFPPVLLKTCVGWALASLSGCNPPAFTLCRFNSCPTHWLVRSTSGEVAGLSSRPEGFDSPTDCFLTKWWNRQTHGPQKAAPAGHGSSTLPLVTFARWASAQQGLISPAVRCESWIRYCEHAALACAACSGVTSTQRKQVPNWPSTQTGKAARSRAW